MTWIRRWIFRGKIRRVREIEAQVRDERSDKMLADLQHKANELEVFLRGRQRENHWQKAIAQMIREKS